MGVIKPANPWGREGTDSLEAQRNDLWAVDLSFANQAIKRQISNLKNLEKEVTDMVTMLPMDEDLVYYASSVELPEQSMRVDIIDRDSTPYPMPGKDEPLPPTQITFLHDAYSGGPYIGSRIYALLHLWRLLVRTGRGNITFPGNNGSINLGDQSNAATSGLVSSSGLIPQFRFPIRVTLYKGGSSILEQGGEGSGAGGIAGVEVSAGYTLNNAWLKSIKVGPLRYAGGAALLEITTQFMCDDLYPVLDNGAAPSTAPSRPYTVPSTLPTPNTSPSPTANPTPTPYVSSTPQRPPTSATLDRERLRKWD